MISFHPFSGCYTVLRMFGIRKAKALSVAGKCTLQLLNQENANITEVIEKRYAL